ncbi:LPS export ABC transporter periplasmic protein LptC [Sulfurivirga sp.]|uniref:LPS export ABC transporter periplasmic protein LptC n=1 Tax=Sulfurivirga sp. TaxID=2614236 RepID=UPI0025F542BB|nr:LPS export ABC transporter periplasmic protein LptC [Sulfurivirga sp.]
MPRRLLTALALIALAGALIYYNHANQPAPPSSTTASKTTLPDWQGENATVWQVREGRSAALHAQRVVHFPRKRTLLTVPTGRIDQPDNTYWFSARKGEQTGPVNQLSGQVRVLLERQTDPAPLLLTTEQLRYLSDARRMESDTLVTIRQKDNWTRGTGMTLWLDAERLELKKDVTSHYVPTP